MQIRKILPLLCTALVLVAAVTVLLCLPEKDSAEAAVTTAPPEAIVWQILYPSGDASALVKLGKSLLTQFEGGLTLAEETRDISGGVILVQDKMEINCAFETLIRLSRDEISPQVANILFS